MRTSKVAKTLLWISSLLVVLPVFAAGPDWEVTPHLDCGFYRASGVLQQNSQGDLVLSGRKNTMAPYELVLLGGNLASLLERLNTQVTIRFYVPKPIRSSSDPSVFLQEIESGLDPHSSVGPVLVKKSQCGDFGQLRSASES
jgi:hypothetical protein